MRILNRRVGRDYQVLETFEAGVALTGPEVKSIKNGRGDLATSFVRIKEGDAWLVGANIPLYQGARPEGFDPLRLRRLLLHKKEIISLSTKTKQQKLTLVPVALYTRGRLVKAKIALARGKRKYEKREAKRRRDIDREVERELKGTLRR